MGFTSIVTPTNSTSSQIVNNYFETVQSSDFMIIDHELGNQDGFKYMNQTPTELRHLPASSNLVFKNNTGNLQLQKASPSGYGGRLLWCLELTNSSINHLLITFSQIFKNQSIVGFTIMPYWIQNSITTTNENEHKIMTNQSTTCTMYVKRKSGYLFFILKVPSEKEQNTNKIYMSIEIKCF